MTRHSRTLALFLALGFAFSCEGFRLRRQLEQDVAAGHQAYIQEPSWAEEGANVSSVEEEEEADAEMEDVDEQEDEDKGEVEEEKMEEQDAADSSFLDAYYYYNYNALDDATVHDKNGGSCKAKQAWKKSHPGKGDGLCGLYKTANKCAKCNGDCPCRWMQPDAGDNRGGSCKATQAWRNYHPGQGDGLCVFHQTANDCVKCGGPCPCRWAAQPHRWPVFPMPPQGDSRRRTPSPTPPPCQKMMYCSGNQHNKYCQEICAPGTR